MASLSDVTSKINEIKTAKSNIRTAIQNKGVTVPTTAKLSSFNTYINSISQSSGGGTTVVQPTLGTKTVDPSTSRQTYNASSDSLDGYSSFTVNAIPSTYVQPSGSRTITENGTNIDVKLLATVNVAVATSSGGSTSSEGMAIDKPSNVVPGTGVKTISFTNLKGRPLWFAMTLEDSIGTSNGYSRCVSVVYDGSTSYNSNGTVTCYGAYLGDQMRFSNTYFTATYSGSTLTIESSSFSDGGYMHGGTNGYRLVYGYGSVASGGSGTSLPTQEKTATPTKETQYVTPDSGYSLSKVTVNPIPNNYIEPSGTLPISANGSFNVSQYASVSVNVASSSGTQLLTGTVTLASDITSTSSTAFKVNVGSSFSNFCAYPENGVASLVNKTCLWGMIPIDDVENKFVGRMNTSDVLAYYTSASAISVSGNTVTLKPYSTTYPVKAGTYRWVAW